MVQLIERSAERDPLQEVFRPLVVDRKYALMYLVNKLGRLDRSEVNRIGEKLKQDKEQGVIRPLGKVYRDVAVEQKGRKTFKEDSYLDHTAIEYDLEEMPDQWRDPAELRTMSDPPHKWATAADWAAGDGAPRPLILELYSLWEQGLINIEREFSGEEIFYPTAEAHAFARHIAMVYRNTRFPTNEVVVLRKNPALTTIEEIATGRPGTP